MLPLVTEALDGAGVQAVGRLWRPPPTADHGFDVIMNPAEGLDADFSWRRDLATWSGLPCGKSARWRAASGPPTHFIRTKISLGLARILVVFWKLVFWLRRDTVRWPRSHLITSRHWGPRASPAVR